MAPVGHNGPLLGAVRTQRRLQAVFLLMVASEQRGLKKEVAAPSPLASGLMIF